MDPGSQIVGVEIQWVPTCYRQSWTLPLWTPGSYTVRDHVQYLHGLCVHQLDRKLSARRTETSTWQVQLDNLAPIKLSYFIEARQLTVRTCYIDPDFASLCLSAAIVEIEGQRWSPYSLSIHCPDFWTSHVPLSGDKVYIAKDFDELVDSPVHAGVLTPKEFIVNGFHHELLLIGQPPNNRWPGDLINDITAVCSATCRLMDSAPPSGNSYQLVILMLDEGYGGLEHDNGAVLHYSSAALTTPDGYRQLLELVGHEYLHQWNVRRLRPADYIPYNYSKPIISEGLWFAEGITSYYDMTLPMLAGLTDRSSFLKDLSQDFSRLLSTPGRNVQSLAESSMEAWVKLYKATATSADSQISYYRLGAAVSFCLDVALRQVHSSLANVLRRLWKEHGLTGRGYNRSDIQKAIAIDNKQLAEQLSAWLDEPGNLPLIESIEALGLSLDVVKSKTAESGLSFVDREGVVQITRVAKNSPGHQAGLVAGDELIAAAGFRIRHASQVGSLIPCDQSITVTYSRRGLLSQVSLMANEPAIERWVLRWNPAASSDEKVLREQWFQII